MKTAQASDAALGRKIGLVRAGGFGFSTVMLTRRSKRIPLAELFLLATLSAVSGELPVETFFRNFARQEVRLSPSGRYLVAIAPRGRHLGLAVVDLETREAQWPFTARSINVRDFRWVNEERLVLGTWDEDGTYGEMFAVNRDGKQLRRLDSGTYWTFRCLSRVPASTNEIFVECLPWTRKRAMFPDLTRLHVYSGQRETAVKNPGYIQEWIADHEGVPRLGIGDDGDHVRLIHRWSPEGPWKTIAAFGLREAGPYPISFTADNRSLYVAYGGDGDTFGLYRFDLEQRKSVELLFRHKEADVTGVVLHPRTEAVSPLNCAERIQAPVFLAYGKRDRRTPIDQGKRLAAELQRHGKTYELMIKGGEGHTFVKAENWVELYQRLDAFLKQHLK